MKIAFLSTFYPFRGGIAQFNANLYRAFEKTSEIKAYTFKRQYPKILFPGKNQFVTNDDIVDKIHAPRILDTINPVTYYTSAKSILKDKPEIVLTKFWMPFLAPSLGTAFKKLKKNGVKTISILDNVIPHEKRIGDIAFIKYFLKQNSGFIIMSDKVKKDLLSLKPDAKYLQIIHPLYDHFGKSLNASDARSHLGLRDTDNVILFFGFIRDYKGLDIIIEAMKLLPENYVLVIAGEVYGSFDKYQKIIDDNSLGNKIKLFTHYIPDNEVPSFFSAADVCVLPYKSGTQSGITSISYHFNLPIIATDVGGLKEMIEDGKTGLVVKEPKPELIAYAIRSYFEEKLKEKFIPNIQIYKKEHSWYNLASHIIEFSKIL